ncbi:MAG TPA: MaoC family dehydratase [Amycolatopsis sp.]|nr:MaoC family dehydratase [Amycolatopsis sp.]
MEATGVELVIFRSVEDLEAAVGRELGPTDWLPIEQARINGFADDTEDHQWIHVDTERAADGPFGGTVAHGFLTLSLLPYFINRIRRIENLRMGVNYGLNKVRFPAPVVAGSRVRCRITMISADRIGDDAIQVVTRGVIEVEGAEKPACVAELVSRHYFD